MSQIWLKCIIEDPESGNVIDRGGDYPLPESLQIKHLEIREYGDRLRNSRLGKLV